MAFSAVANGTSSSARGRLAAAVAVLAMGVVSPGLSGADAPPAIGPPVADGFTYTNVSNEAAGSLEPHVAVDPDDAEHMVVAWTRFPPASTGLVEDITKSECGVATTFDGGGSWHRTSLKSATEPQCIDVSVGFGPAGGGSRPVYESGIGLGGGRSAQLGVWRSNDGGVSFKPPAILHGGLDPLDQVLAPSGNDNPFLAVDPESGAVYVVAMTTTNDVFSHAYTWASTDGGDTFVGPVKVTSTQHPPRPPAISSITVGAGGVLAVAYRSKEALGEPKCECFALAVSEDGGATFTTRSMPVPVLGGENPEEHSAYVQVAGDPTRPGRFAAVWGDTRFNNGDVDDPDMVLAITDDHGKTWGDPVRLNDDPVGNKAVQDHQWLSYGADGSLVVTWRDRRHTPTGGPKHMTLYLVESADGGATFGPNLAVSPTVPSPGSASGDNYRGADVGPDGSIAAVWSAPVGATTDVFVTRRAPESGGPPPPPGSPPGPNDPPIPGSVPGQWGTTDQTDFAAADFPAWWPGEKNLKGQWYKILPDDFDRAVGGWDYARHVKIEPPHNLYYLWRAEGPVPEGTKFLLEGDFPHARFMNVQMLPPNIPGTENSGDGAGLPEVPLADVDIEPDPGSHNPFRPNPFGRDVPDDQRHYHLTYELREGDPIALNTFNGKASFLPPYRAPGNLRVGGTSFGEGAFGPEIYVRVHLPDKIFDNDGNIYDDEAYAGVEPPVLRIQYPGSGPILAPPTRRSEYNFVTRDEHDKPYSVEENPVLPNDAVDKWRWNRSRKELDALDVLHQFGEEEVAGSGTAGSRSLATHAVWNGPDGTIDLYKSHQPSYFVNFFLAGGGAQTSTLGCLAAKPLTAQDGLGPDFPPPANDEHGSGQNMHTTYMVSKVSITPGVALVMRGKLPAIPRTLGGVTGVPPGDTRYWTELDMRYWAIDFMVGQPKSIGRFVGVLDIIDEDIRADADGNYTIVVGLPGDKPDDAVIEDQHITWRPWIHGSSATIIWRMNSTGSVATGETWQHHPRHITWADMNNYCERGNPNAVRSRMGQFAPILRYVTADNVDAGVYDAPSPYDTVPLGGLNSSAKESRAVDLPFARRWR